MVDKILYVAVDVDDKAFTGSCLSGDRSVKQDFRLRPNAEELDAYIKKFQQKGWLVRICYESTYLGFSLQRDLAKLGNQCDVIASALIPTLPGNPKKTDRLDARKLVDMYAAGLLTVCHVPDAHDEQVRNFVRSRRFVRGQVTELKNHLSGLCRRNGIDYRKSTGKLGAHLWTITHQDWLNMQVKKQERTLKTTFELLLMQLEQQESLLALYETEIKKIAETERYKKPVQALCCLRGIDVLTAMTMVAELGDISRFDHPNRLASFAGMDLREYSSGGKEKKFGITKMGNAHLRTAAIEACQFALQTPRISKKLKVRREEVDLKFIAIADRCMNRLYKKGTRLFYGGKHRNKVKVACARELLCFVWEALTYIRKGTVMQAA